MKLTAKQAALLSDRERSMLASKGPWQIKQLVSLIKRSRDLRDKYRHQAQRQSIAAASRTLQKADIFDSALKQFEAELAKISTECNAAMRELKVGKNPVRQKTQANKTASKKVVHKTSQAKK